MVSKGQFINDSTFITKIETLSVTVDFFIIRNYVLFICYILTFSYTLTYVYGGLKKSPFR